MRKHENPTWAVIEGENDSADKTGVGMIKKQGKEFNHLKIQSQESERTCPGCRKNAVQVKLEVEVALKDVDLTSESLELLQLKHRHDQIKKDMLNCDVSSIDDSVKRVLFTCDVCHKPFWPSKPTSDSWCFYTCSANYAFIADNGEEIEEVLEEELKTALLLSLSESQSFNTHPRGVVICQTCMSKGETQVAAEYLGDKASAKMSFCSGQRCHGSKFAQPGFILGYEKAYASVCPSCFLICGKKRSKASRDKSYSFSKPRYGLSPFRCQCIILGDCLYAKHCSFDLLSSDIAYRTQAKKDLIESSRSMLELPINPLRGFSSPSLRAYIESRLQMIVKWEKNSWSYKRARKILDENFDRLREKCVKDFSSRFPDRQINFAEITSLNDLICKFDITLAIQIERWIWSSFMIWMTWAKPKCLSCGARCKHFNETYEKISFKCLECDNVREIPRYHDAFQLLSNDIDDRNERFGRCGEFAQMNYLMIRAAGYDVRWVDDQKNKNDHVWIEIFSKEKGRWIERGANQKNRNYVFAFSNLGVFDVTPRYVGKRGLDFLIKTRQWLPETVLELYLAEVNQDFRSMPIAGRNFSEKSDLVEADLKDKAFEEWLRHRKG